MAFQVQLDGDGRVWFYTQLVHLQMPLTKRWRVRVGLRRPLPFPKRHIIVWGLLAGIPVSIASGPRQPRGNVTWPRLALDNRPTDSVSTPPFSFWQTIQWGWIKSSPFESFFCPCNLRDRLRKLVPLGDIHHLISPGCRDWANSLGEPTKIRAMPSATDSSFNFRPRQRPNILTRPAESGPAPFIITTSLAKPDPKTRKLIRSHVMRGKNAGRFRPKIHCEGLQEKPPLVADKATGCMSRPQRLLRNTAESEGWALITPRKIASELLLFGFSSDMQPYVLGLVYRGMSSVWPLRPPLLHR